MRELRVRAFIRMIRVGEGTSGKSGYEKLFGGQSFIKDYSKNFDNHPNIKIRRQGYISSAAGAYQVMAYTWNDKAMIRIREKLQIKDFTPESQDRFCIALLRYKIRSNPLLTICDGKIEEAIKKCSTEWASLPTSPYGQPVKTMEESLKSYEIFLKEEIEGRTELYLRKGFLSTYL
ncbi:MULTISPECIES: glycoside hydrolase family 104 protein [Pseudomonas]|uniref:glycoside hydrolase family 24 protein n=1 Tax=Pseudomonadaceae TaxID=135621 RepID=UPI0012DF91B7|nr:MULTISPECIES: glycoside hydrolase family 104 protein [Pseudomonas]